MTNTSTAIPVSDKDAFESSGYIGPLEALSENECHDMATAMIEELGDLAERKKPKGVGHKIKRLGMKLGLTTKEHKTSGGKYNRHFDWPLIEALVSNPRILDAVKSTLGPDIVLWRSNIFCQYASDTDSLPWHRDQYNQILHDVDKQVSVQLAISETTKENCLEVLPGSHSMSNEEISEAFKMSIKENADPAGNTHYHTNEPLSIPTQVILNRGEFILFHPDTLHRSSISDGSEAALRLCVTLRYTVPGNLISTPERPRKEVPV